MSWRFWLAIVILVAGAGIAAWVLRDDPSQALGVLGVLVSAVGVVIAVAIYGRQGAEAREAERRYEGYVNQLADSVLDGVTATVRASGEEGDNDPDRFETESEAMSEYGRKVGDGVQRLARDQVPLTLIADVVDYWRRNGGTGRWNLERLDSALRKTGKGNHPWFIVFRGDDGQPAVWKVSRGGKKDQSTVVPVTLDP